jgi:o-succinylbenzoate synthase
MHCQYFTHQLHFHQTARTSRGEMQTHKVYFIRINNQGRYAWGEAAPLTGLSIDSIEKIEQHLADCCSLINDGFPAEKIDHTHFPSVAFAFETALLALKNENPFKLFDTAFYNGQKGIDINGLIWMDSKEKMLESSFKKILEGYTCIKFKVGALDFDEECRMLEQVRNYANAFKLEIRLDANGAFTADDALKKLAELKRFDIHSMEQPIKANQVELMAEICAKSPIHIALDEELIGVEPDKMGMLLQKIQPHYIVLKPTLLGGLKAADKWIQKAQQQAVCWWATSALESNIGLNAIAQWCSTYELAIPQGLGTGMLYKNNIPSPLHITGQKLYYQADKIWETTPIENENN